MNEEDPLSPLIKSSYSSITKEVGVEVPSHAQRILKKLSTMRSNAKLCDTELCCQGQTFLVHRSVLAGGSAYFSNYFDRWMEDPEERRVVLQSVEPGALALLLDFLYSGILDINTNNMFDIFVAADTLQVEEARYVCITKLHMHISPDSCVETLNFAMLYSLHALAEAAINLICSETLVYNSGSGSGLSESSWEEMGRWMREHRGSINPYTACYNLLQIRPSSTGQLNSAFAGMIDERTERLLATQVKPTAFSILCAARANADTKAEVTKAEHTSPQSDTEKTETDANLAEDSQRPSMDGTRDEPVPEGSNPPHVSSTGPPPAPKDRSSQPLSVDSLLSQEPSRSSLQGSLRAPGIQSKPATYPNSRLWSITCNHPGYTTTFGEERALKKRKLAGDTRGKPQWAAKIVMLGGCNSTMSTVRTIFRHIQPFSVVTGVTVVRDNLSLEVCPERKRDVEEWEDSGSLAQLCYGCTAVTVGSKAYVFGGKDMNSQYLADLQEFDVLENTCRLLPKGPQPKENAVAVRIGSDIYIVGGRNNTVQNSQYTVDKYNIVSGTWSTVSPCFKIGYQGAAAACNGLLYTFCGQRPHGKPTDTVMCYEPHSDSWSPQPNAPTTMNSCQATTHHRKIFLLATEYKNLILYHFQPEQQLWTKINKCQPHPTQSNFFIMNSAIVSHEGFLFVLLFMCEDVIRVIRVQRFNVTTGEWDIISTKPVPVQNSGVILANYMSDSS